jgi:hypothetical protein
MILSADSGPGAGPLDRAGVERYLPWPGCSCRGLGPCPRVRRPFPARLPIHVRPAMGESE